MWTICEGNNPLDRSILQDVFPPLTAQPLPCDLVRASVVPTLTRIPGRRPCHVWCGNLNHVIYVKIMSLTCFKHVFFSTFDHV